MKINLNASAAKTWTECTAQPRYVAENADRIPPQNTEYSVEGTIAHSVVEAFLKREDQNDFRGLPEKHTPEMIKHAKDFVQFCRDRQGDAISWWSELKVDLFYMSGRNGYVDYCSVSETDIHIIDYKYGVGVAVNAFENLQMAIYARSMIKQQKLTPPKDFRISMHIVQPRVRQGDKISTWTISYSELVQFTDDRILGPAEDIKAKALTLRFAPSSETCQFCPASSFCTARVAWMLGETPLEKVVKGEAEPKALPKAADITPDVLSRVLLKASEIKKWLSKLEEYALEMALDGKTLPNMKLVQGKGGHRKWIDKDKAKELLLEICKREDVITEELISPTKVSEFEFDFSKEAWAKIQTLIIKPEGGPTLASEDDPRPEYTLATEEFEDESSDIC